MTLLICIIKNKMQKRNMSPAFFVKLLLHEHYHSTLFETIHYFSWWCNFQSCRIKLAKVTDVNRRCQEAVAQQIFTIYFCKCPPRLLEIWINWFLFSMRHMTKWCSIFKWLYVRHTALSSESSKIIQQFLQSSVKCTTAHNSSVQPHMLVILQLI